MPINVKVVSQDEFENWLSFAKEEYASSKTNFNQTFQVAKN
jgi:heme/copper-type cytochrome/quinol oxidase subunit 2